MKIKHFALTSFALGVVLVGCGSQPAQNTQTQDDAAMEVDAGSDSSVYAMAGWTETDGTWTDADGNRVKMMDGAVMVSKDGQNWTAPQNGAFKAADGKWYKWDAEGELVVSADGKTWTVLDFGQWPGKDNSLYMLEADGDVLMKADASAGMQEPGADGLEDETQGVTASVGGAVSAGAAMEAH